jgi:MFS family permease
LLPVFSKNILKGTAQTQGLLLSVAGIGSLSSAIYMASRKTIRDLMPLSMAMAAVGSVALIVFAQSRSLVLSLVMMLFIGWGMTLQMAATNTLIQSTVSDKMRGRVLSVYTMAFGSMTPFGSLLMGSLTKVMGFGATGEAARALGAQRALTISAVVCLLWTLNGFRLIPALVRGIFRMLVRNNNVSVYRPAIIRAQVNPGEL